MDLRTSTHSTAGHDVLALDGIVDLASLPLLHDALRRFIDDRSGDRAIAIDLDGVGLLDDAALGLLLGAAANARARDIEVRVICNNERLRHRLATSRFDRAVDVSGSLSEQVPHPDR